jgi:hypothetical protein
LPLCLAPEINIAGNWASNFLIKGVKSLFMYIRVLYQIQVEVKISIDGGDGLEKLSNNFKIPNNIGF